MAEEVSPQTGGSGMSCACMLHLIYLMSTPDETNNHGLWKLGGTPPIVIIQYFLMVPPQFNGRLGFINPGLHLFCYCVILY